MPTKINVEWLKEKCLAPQDCRRCLQVCPSTVFCLYSPNRVRYKKSERYMIVPAFKHACVICNKCIDVCPYQAIKVEVKKQS